MLQYLLNLTATWLLSLIIFDMFLKKETYHGYNRVYLMSTFLIGIFLPFWSWGNDSAIYNTTVGVPLKKATAVRQGIESAASGSSAISFSQYLEYIYLVGVIVSALLLVFEVSKIIVLYQVGTRYKEGKWTVVETVKGHAPFSIFHILFVDSKEQYSQEEWSIILDHEEQHSSYWHIIDQVILQLSRIVFWFHPLVYIYNNRLMLLHEYQADKVSGKQPAVYGKFLVEQALLHAAPRLTHSFNRSPIKTRITMLTKNSSLLAKTKTVLFIPLVFICALCFSKNTYSNKIEKHGNFATYHGNTFEFTPPSGNDTVVVMDPVTGKENMMIMTKTPYPIKMNDKKIYSHNDLEGKTNALGKPSNEEAGFNADNIREYLVTGLSKELAALPDNEYRITFSNIVVDENGKIVYFEYEGISTYKKPSTKPDTVALIDKAVEKKIADKVYDLLNNAPAHSPGVIDGNAVPFYIVEMAPFWNPFTIKDHKVVKL